MSGHHSRLVDIPPFLDRVVDLLGGQVTRAKREEIERELRAWLKRREEARVAKTAAVDLCFTHPKT